MLIPSRTKYRRVHRLPHEGRSRGNRELTFGQYGLQAKEGAWITANQIEAARIAMTRYMKRGGRVWINIFPHMPLTKKPIGTRQGKGKGNVEGWVAVVKEGKVICPCCGEEVVRSPEVTLTRIPYYYYYCTKCIYAKEIMSRNPIPEARIDYTEIPEEYKQQEER